MLYKIEVRKVISTLNQKTLYIPFKIYFGIFRSPLIQNFIWAKNDDMKIYEEHFEHVPFLIDHHMRYFIGYGIFESKKECKEAILDYLVYTSNVKGSTKKSNLRAKLEPTINLDDVRYLYK